MSFTLPRQAALALSLLFSVLAATSAQADERLERGAYLATIMDCGGCHTPGALMGQPDPERYLAGSAIGFHVPGLGIFYPPNLTSDPETGLGDWSEAEIVAAIREGVRPDGRMLVPVMPYPHYGSLTDEDAFALAAYLKSLAPIKLAVPPPTGEGEKPVAPYLTLVVPQ